jgi:hypothetical protein
MSLEYDTQEKKTAHRRSKQVADEEIKAQRNQSKKKSTKFSKRKQNPRPTRIGLPRPGKTKEDQLPLPTPNFGLLLRQRRVDCRVAAVCRVFKWALRNRGLGGGSSRDLYWRQERVVLRVGAQVMWQ